MKPPFYKSRAVPLFPAGFALCVAETVEEAAQIVAKRHLGATVRNDGEKRGGMCVWYGSETGACFARSHLRHGTIAHEIRHAVDILKARFCFGGTSEPGIDEVAAYLTDELTGWTYQQLARAGEAVKP